jgi:hypothetical protein
MTSWNSYESPQTRRLRSDAAAMERLAAESSILRFKVGGAPPNRYLVEFRGKSLTRERGRVGLREEHRVEIKLGAMYPRTMPELRWLTPIFHPNISEIGMVCLGGYATHWVPSLRLDALCQMLWDMARYYNYDIRSPYNREAALWAANQTAFGFPIDPRPLRDVRVAQGRIEAEPSAPFVTQAVAVPAPAPTAVTPDPPATRIPTPPPVPAGNGASTAAPAGDSGIIILDNPAPRAAPAQAAEPNDEILIILE